MFEYVIRAEDGTDSQVFGPFSGDQMTAWMQQGYFQGNVQIRIKVGPNKGTFRNALHFDIDKGKKKKRKKCEKDGMFADLFGCFFF